MKLDKYKLITASLVGVTVCSGLVITAAHPDTPASSSSSANASITVSNTINLTLTGGDLVIDNLTPGSASDSNIITATITSNSPYGYHLSATTGTSTGTTSLVNTADSNFSFTNLNTNKATLNDFSDNTWGYSYSTDNGTSWISGDYGTALSGYNGLTLDNDDSGATGTTLFNNDSYAGSTAVKFKIGAKSATTQAAGTYTGTVNFYAVTNPKPATINTLTYMQDFATLSSSDKESVLASMTANESYILRDNRDNKDYYITKLSDGNVWMTQNLDFDIGSATIDSSNTDVPSNWNDTLTSTYATGVTTWNDSPTTPESYNPGDLCWNGTFDEDWETDLSAGTVACSQHADHYHIGNYYNWTAAVAMQNSSSYTTNNTDLNQSICPAGWRLPISGTTNTGTKSFQYLVNQASLTSGVSGNIQNTPTYFVYGGGWDSLTGDVGSSGDYWSSVVHDSASAFHLNFNVNNYLRAKHYYDRDYGVSVRCVVR